MQGLRGCGEEFGICNTYLSELLKELNELSTPSALAEFLLFGRQCFWSKGRSSEQHGQLSLPLWSWYS